MAEQTIAQVRSRYFDAAQIVARVGFRATPRELAELREAADDYHQWLSIEGKSTAAIPLDHLSYEYKIQMGLSTG